MGRVAERKEGKNDEICGWRDRCSSIHPADLICHVKDFGLDPDNDEKS